MFSSFKSKCAEFYSVLQNDTSSYYNINSAEGDISIYNGIITVNMPSDYDVDNLPNTEIKTKSFLSEYLDKINKDGFVQININKHKNKDKYSDNMPYLNILKEIIKNNYTDLILLNIKNTNTSKSNKYFTY